MCTCRSRSKKCYYTSCGTNSTPSSSTPRPRSARCQFPCSLFRPPGKMSHSRSSSSSFSAGRPLHELKQRCDAEICGLILQDSQLAVEALLNRLSELTSVLFNALLLAAPTAAGPVAGSQLQTNTNITSKSNTFTIKDTLKAWLDKDPSKVSPDAWQDVYVELLDVGLIEACGELVGTERREVEVRGGGTTSTTSPARVGMMVVRHDRDWRFGMLDGKKGLPGRIVGIVPASAAEGPTSLVVGGGVSRDSGTSGVATTTGAYAAVEWMRGQLGKSSVGSSSSSSENELYGDPMEIDGEVQDGLVAGGATRSSNAHIYRLGVNGKHDLRVFGKFTVPESVVRAKQAIFKRGLTDPTSDVFWQRSVLFRRQQRVNKALHCVNEWELHTHCAKVWTMIFAYLSRPKATRDGFNCPWWLKSLLAERLALTSLRVNNLTPSGFGFVFSARHRQLWELVHGVVEDLSRDAEFLKLENMKNQNAAGASAAAGAGDAAPAGAAAPVPEDKTTERLRRSIKASLYSLLLQLSHAKIGSPLLLLPGDADAALENMDPAPAESVADTEVGCAWMFDQKKVGGGAAAEKSSTGGAPSASPIAAGSAAFWSYRPPNDADLTFFPDAFDVLPGTGGAEAKIPRRREYLVFRSKGYKGLSPAQSEFLHRLTELGILLGKAVYLGTPYEKLPPRSIERTLFDVNHVDNRTKQARAEVPDEIRLRRKLKCVLFYPTAFCAALFDEEIGLAVTRGEFEHTRIAAKVAENWSPLVDEEVDTQRRRAEMYAAQKMFRGILVESNFKLRACTNDPNLIDLLRTFAAIYRQSGHWVCGELTQDSVLSAFANQKLSAKQILNFLAVSAHESKTASSGSPQAVPDNVRIQLLLWEKDRQRLSLSPATRIEWSHEATGRSGKDRYEEIMAHLTPQELLASSGFENYDRGLRTGVLPFLIVDREGGRRAMKNVEERRSANR